ncbi:MAG: hypothetical protein LBH25_09725 [Fibromonadaceae bacterium]|jgi:hypothetical protein|nr:hypothetical protein [Fibromonadaceae bacterium]
MNRKNLFFCVFIIFAGHHAFAECPANIPMEKSSERKPAWLKKRTSNAGKSSWFRVAEGNGSSGKEAVSEALAIANIMRGAECTPQTCREEDSYAERCNATDYRYYALMQFKNYNDSWEEMPKELLKEDKE